MFSNPNAMILLLVLLAAAALFVSRRQFLQKGFLLNNAYLFASKEERRKMDRAPQEKRPHYRQSGFVFLFLGIAFLLYAGYLLRGWPFLQAGFWAAVLLTVVYAVASSIKDQLCR